MAGYRGPRGKNNSKKASPGALIIAGAVGAYVGNRLGKKGAKETSPVSSYAAPSVTPAAKNLEGASGKTRTFGPIASFFCFLFGLLLILLGLPCLMVSQGDVSIFIASLVLLLCGILLFALHVRNHKRAKRNKRIARTLALEKEAEQKWEAEQKRERDAETENAKLPWKKRMTDTLNNNREAFADGKLFKDCCDGLLVFGKSGNIGIFSYLDETIRIIKISDVTGMHIKRRKVHSPSLCALYK